MSETPAPVSILIPVYNCRSWVARAIESALQQTWQNKEVIVLDDGSTDGSMEAIAPYSHRVRVEASPNGGQNVSRNRLTALSRGEWLLYLDADDELAPASVEQKMLFASSADVVYGSNEVATFRAAEKTAAYNMLAVDFPDPWVAAFLWKFPNTSAMLFRRGVVLDAGGWNEGIQNCTDYDLYFRLLANNYRFKAAPEAWSLYRQWSVSQAVNEVPLRIIRTRFAVMWAAAERLRETGQLTPKREQAFLDAAMGSVRLMYPLDATLAIEEHHRLLEWKPQFQPSSGFFPTRYRLIYRLLGFSAAERLAGWLRSRRQAHA